MCLFFVVCLCTVILILCTRIHTNINRLWPMRFSILSQGSLLPLESSIHRFSLWLQKSINELKCELTTFLFFGKLKKSKSLGWLTHSFNSCFVFHNDNIYRKRHYVLDTVTQVSKAIQHNNLLIMIVILLIISKVNHLKGSSGCVRAINGYIYESITKQYWHIKREC